MGDAVTIDNYDVWAMLELAEGFNHGRHFSVCEKTWAVGHCCMDPSCLCFKNFECFCIADNDARNDVLVYICLVNACNCGDFSKAVGYDNLFDQG